MKSVGTVIALTVLSALISTPLAAAPRTAGAALEASATTALVKKTRSAKRMKGEANIAPSLLLPILLALVAVAAAAAAAGSGGGSNSP